MMLEQFGRPKAFYWDNGGDFDCLWVQGLMEGLGVRVIHALPGLARSKPIEPNFKRVSIWEEGLPTCTGRNPMRRPERLEKLETQFKGWVKKGGECPFPTLPDLRETYKVIFADINARQLRRPGMDYMSPEGKAWFSPLECWERLIVNVPFERVPQSALNSLMRDHRERKVRSGQIRMTFAGEEFIYMPAADYPSNVLADLNGKTVSVAVDPLDLGKVVVYYHDELVCVCQNLELVGMGEDAFKEAMKTQRRILRIQKEELKLVRAQGPLDPVANAQRALAAAGEFVEPQRQETTLVYTKHEQMAAALGGGGRERFALDKIEATRSWEVRPVEQGDEFDPLSDS
jgi:hypothetical protein